jgi:hypothetical protein
MSHSDHEPSEVTDSASTPIILPEQTDPPVLERTEPPREKDETPPTETVETPPVEKSGAPVLKPGMKPPEPENVPYRQTALAKRKIQGWREAYEKCRMKGRERQHSLDVRPVPQPRPVEEFRAHYRTVVVANSDSPTGEALLSKWVDCPLPDESHGYKNTPLPALGVLRSWQNARALKGKEPFTNADVYFHQYQLAHRTVHGDAPLPKLRTLRRQQAGASDTQDVFAYMGWERDIAGDVRGQFGPDSDWFAALLGTMNGTAAVHLVLQYGPQLGITKIVMIEIADGNDLIFTFD